MRVRYEKQAAKTLDKMPAKIAASIREKVEALASGNTAPNLDIKPMHGGEGGYRLRQGGWRVLLYRENDTLIVGKIKPRGDVYK